MEAWALLNDSLALDLEPAEVALLRERTEGWPAGLRLAALSLRDHDDPKAFVATFAGDDRQITEYLHEFVAAQPRRLREFLLRTSILERLCAALCDAVTGRSDGTARLEEIQRANLFLVSFDRRGEWFRYHHLFRDLLRLELARSEPGLGARELQAQQVAEQVVVAEPLATAVQRDQEQVCPLNLFQPRESV